MSKLSPITLSLIANQTQYGTGFWKLNTSLLDDAQYRLEINKVLTDEINTEHQTQAQRWEVKKMKVRGKSIEFATKKKKSNQNKLLVLERKLLSLEREISQGNKPVESLVDPIAQIALVQKEMNELYDLKTKVAIIRSRINWLKAGEKPTSYFLRLEAQNASDKV